MFLDKYRINSLNKIKYFYKLREFPDSNRNSTSSIYLTILVFSYLQKKKERKKYNSRLIAFPNGLIYDLSNIVLSSNINEQSFWRQRGGPLEPRGSSVVHLSFFDEKRSSKR